MPSITAINPLTRPDWDALVMSHPGHTVFHTVGWAKALAESYSFEPVYTMACEKDQLLGLMPCMEIKSFFTGKRGVCLPFTDTCNPLSSDTVPADTLLAELLNLGRRRGWRSIECRGRDGLSANAPVSVEFYSHTLDLTPGEKRVFDCFDSSVRRAIRKAEKSGVGIEIGRDIGSVRTYYMLHCNTRKRHGLPPQPWSFFVNLYKDLIAPGLGFVVIAKENHGVGRPVAGAVILRFGQRAVYKYGAADLTRQEIRGSNLVMWHAIWRCIEHGCVTFDFGRTSIEDDGLRRFKLGWGTTESRIGYLKYDLRQEKYVFDRDRAHGWHNRIFRLVPVPVGRIVGALVYPHVA